MPLGEVIDYIKTYGGVCAPLLLVAILWLERERKEAIAEAKEANTKLAALSERTIVLFTEIKGILGNK